MSDQIQNHFFAGGNLRKRKIMVNNFLGGLAWGFGSVLGATVIVAILLGMLQAFNFIPGVGKWANNLSTSLQERSTYTQPAKNIDKSNE